MKKIMLYLAVTLVCFMACTEDTQIVEAEETTPQGMVSIQQFGVLPENLPEQNRENLQAAIDWYILG